MHSTRKGFLKSLAGIAAGARLAAAAVKSGSPQHKIAGIDLYPFSLEPKQVIRIALGTMAVEDVLVRLRTADGIIGWGEASPYPPVTGDTQSSSIEAGKLLGKTLIGRDPFEIPKLIAEMNSVSAGFPSIKAALEIALWDICGKIAGQPVCHLLGQYRDSFETDRTVFLDKPEIMAAKSRDVVNGGFKIVKIKLGEAPELDIERIRVIRTALGSRIRLRCDANQGWTPAEAVRALRGLEKYNLEFCEQPVLSSDWEGLKYVRTHVGIPIMADESVHSAADAIESVRRDAADMFNIKVMKAGGILPSARIAEIAEAANMKCMVGCMSETRVALTAAAHVAAAHKCIQYADLDSFTEHRIDPVIGGIEVHNGVITVPDGPGLGLDVDPAFLKTLKAA